MSPTRKTTLTLAVAVLLVVFTSHDGANAFQWRLPAQRGGGATPCTQSLLKLPVPRHTTGRPTSPTSSSLQMVLPSVAASAAAPVGSVLVLCLVVLIHEMGHYLAARTFGMKVSEFSIGVGPKLLGFQALGNDFSLRALPLGGYVKFPENYNTTLVEEEFDKERTARMTARKITSSSQDDGTDVYGNSALVAGFLNIVTLGQYQKGIEDLREEVAKMEQAEKTPWYKKLFKIQGPTSKSSKPKATNNPFEIEYYTDPDLLQNRPWQQRAVVIGGGIVFNFILAFSIYFGEIITFGLAQPTFGNGAVVASVPKAASAGILQQGDVIVRVNGRSLASTDSIINAAVAQQSIADFIAQIRETVDAETLALSVVRSNQAMEVTVQPTQVSGVKSIGVLLKPNFLNIELIRTRNIPQAASLAAKSVTEITATTAQGLSGFLGKVLQGKGAPAGQGISGPVGLIRTGSQVVSSNDLSTILAFAAAISVNLAVVNSLPLPALDGGQMVFILFEAVSGRKVDQRLQESIVSVAVLLLLLVTVRTTFSDVESMFR